MLLKEELEAIKVGNFVKYEDKFLNESDIIIARVKETRVRCGEQGDVFEDYLITVNDKELDYKDVLQHITPDKLEFFLEQNGKYTPHIFEVIKRDQEYKVTDQVLFDALSGSYSGKSLGGKFEYMDIQPDWHKESIEKLQYKNVSDYVANYPNPTIKPSFLDEDLPHGASAIEEEKGEEK